MRNIRIYLGGFSKFFGSVLQSNDYAKKPTEALERVKADLLKLPREVQQFPAWRKQFKTIYAILDEPIWSMVSKDNKKLANWMDDNFRELNEMVSKDEMLFSELKENCGHRRLRDRQL